MASRDREHAPPVPPFDPLPARTVVVPGRGEMFVRDSGGDGQPVLLLHGWMASADLNWSGAYEDLVEAGYRVLAIDHRGHGRGLRSTEPFRLVDCAADAAGTLRELGAAPAIAVGYSMGGAIAQLLARDHRDVLSGLVLSGTKMEFGNPREVRVWRAMIGLRAMLQVAPYETWRRGLARVGYDNPRHTAWIASELLRHSAHARESKRPSSRPASATSRAECRSSSDAIQAVCRGLS
jgi:3-oxoadipate enol-lactonase